MNISFILQSNFTKTYMHARTQTQKKVHHHVIDPKEGPTIIRMMVSTLWDIQY